MLRLFKVIKYFAIGVLLGSFIFLVIILSNGGMTVKANAILSVFLFSGMIGLVSMLFETDWFNFPIRLGLHVLATFGLVCLMSFFAGWGKSKYLLSNAITFVVTYIVVWLMLYLSDIINTKKINGAIRKRKEK